MKDIKARDAELINNPDFSLVVGKITFAERVDGGTNLLETISKCKTGETTAIGAFHGFELLVEKLLRSELSDSKRKTEYKMELSTSPVGNMVKLENTFAGISENEISFIRRLNSMRMI